MSEWHVVWVPAAVERIGLMPGNPVFIAPDFTIDSDLLEFVLSKHFRFLARETKRNYATDIRILLTLLSSRGIDWRRASEQDLLNYRTWRCDAPQNPERMSGSKWNREAAALTRLSKWARVSPRPVDASRREDRAADSVSARVSWLTPRT
ncbi:site-specific integrase [Streptomyces sp. NPDC060198]|uniref:site-specific integrase n=1 Tax=Streptomyces sp. NPDC060198 TaxID=3347070 RepID=UPI003667928D